MQNMENENQEWIKIICFELAIKSWGKIYIYIVKSIKS